MLTYTVARATAKRNESKGVRGSLCVNPTFRIEFKRVFVVERIVVVWDKIHVDDSANLDSYLLNLVILDDLSS